MGRGQEEALGEKIKGQEKGQYLRTEHAVSNTRKVKGECGDLQLRIEERE